MEKTAAGTGIGAYRRGDVLTDLALVTPGQLVAYESKRFKSVNLCKITETFKDKLYAIFVNPDNPAEKSKTSDEEFVVYPTDLKQGEYYIVLEPSPEQVGEPSKKAKEPVNVTPKAPENPTVSEETGTPMPTPEGAPAVEEAPITGSKKTAGGDHTSTDVGQLEKELEYCGIIGANSDGITDGYDKVNVAVIGAQRSNNWAQVYVSLSQMGADYALQDAWEGFQDNELSMGDEDRASAEKDAAEVGMTLEDYIMEGADGTVYILPFDVFRKLIETTEAGKKLNEGLKGSLTTDFAQVDADAKESVEYDERKKSEVEGSKKTAGFPGYHGIYNELEYSIADQSGDTVYQAGNSPWDSQAYLSKEEGVGLETMKEYCEQTGKELAEEAGVEWEGCTYQPIETTSSKKTANKYYPEDAKKVSLTEDAPDKTKNISVTYTFNDGNKMREDESYFTPEGFKEKFGYDFVDKTANEKTAIESPVRKNKDYGEEPFEAQKRIDKIQHKLKGIEKKADVPSWVPVVELDNLMDYFQYSNALADAGIACSYEEKGGKHYVRIVSDVLADATDKQKITEIIVTTGIGKNLLSEPAKKQESLEKKAKKYTISFVGRETGAIGVTYPITTTVEADNEEAAKKKVYEKYEHCTNWSIKEASLEKKANDPYVVKEPNLALEEKLPFANLLEPRDVVEASDEDEESEEEPEAELEYEFVYPKDTQESNELGEEYFDDPEAITINEDELTAYYAGKRIAKITSEQYGSQGLDALAGPIYKWMEREQYWPNVILQGERGNQTVLSINKKGALDDFEARPIQNEEFEDSLGSRDTFAMHMFANTEAEAGSDNDGDDGSAYSLLDGRNFSGVNEENAEGVVAEYLDGKAMSLASFEDFAGFVEDIYGISKDITSDYEDAWVDEDQRKLVACIMDNAVRNVIG